MSFISRLRQASQEKRELREKEDRVYQEFLAEERSKAKKEREEYRLNRAAERAQRDARNPSFMKRLAKSTAQDARNAFEGLTSAAGEKFREMQKVRHTISEARRKARIRELSKIAAKQERERITGSKIRQGNVRRETFPKAIDHNSQKNLLGSKYPSTLSSSTKRNKILDGFY